MGVPLKSAHRFSSNPNLSPLQAPTPDSPNFPDSPGGSTPRSPLPTLPKSGSAATVSEQDTDSQASRVSLEYSDVVVDEDSLELEELMLSERRVDKHYYPWYPEKVFMLRPGPTSMFNPKVRHESHWRRYGS